MESNEPIVITKRHGNSIYYWYEKDQMLWKQVLPTRGMRVVAKVYNPSDIDKHIMKDINGE